MNVLFIGGPPRREPNGHDEAARLRERLTTAEAKLHALAARLEDLENATRKSGRTVGVKRLDAVEERLEALEAARSRRSN